MIKELGAVSIWSADLNNADPARHLVGLATDDLVADWRWLKAAGVEFVEDPTDYDTVSIATLQDPEGNLVQLLQRRPTRGPS
jgi:predicted enzyme related to lactoylglutathione lyase